MVSCTYKEQSFIMGKKYSSEFLNKLYIQQIKCLINSLFTLKQGANFKNNETTKQSNNFYLDQ